MIAPMRGRGSIRLAMATAALAVAFPCSSLPAALAGSVAAQAAPPAIDLPETIPIFPLEDVMLFPHASRPLHIFEERYRQMVADALAGDGVIGMVMLQSGYEDDYEGNPPIYEIGTAGVISNVEELPDGRYNIVLQGLTKFRVTSEDRSRAYRIADVVAMPEPLGEDDRAPLRQHRPLLLQLLASIDQREAPTPDELPDAALVDGLAQFLGMSRFDRMDLLRQEGSLARADALVAMLNRGELSR